MEKHVKLLNSKNSVWQLQSEIKELGEVLRPMKSSSTNMARFLSSNLDDTTNVSFSDIKNKVSLLVLLCFNIFQKKNEIKTIVHGFYAGHIVLKVIIKIISITCSRMNY